MTKAETTARKFVEEWMSNGQNATAAYLKVKPNVTYKTATVESSKYLAKPSIQSLIESMQESDSERNQITRDSLLVEYQEIKERNKAKDDRIAVLAMQEQAKLLGLNAPEKHENVNRNFEAVSNEEIDSILNKYQVDARIKSRREEDKMASGT